MSKKILIIEDDEFLGDVLVQKIKKEGYDAELAKDGAVGLRRIGEYKPDLILLDIMLPSLNGYEILEQKIKEPSIAAIPVIIISNSGQPVEISRVLSLGVKDYLVKAQFDPEEVIKKVKVQLSEPQSSGETGAQSTEKPKLLSGKKIMWVEDDSFLSEIIIRKFANQGCELFHLSEGEGTVAEAKAKKPDIILLDILLPGMTGFDILVALKADPETKDIPVILLSNLGQKSDVEKGKELGAVKFIIKAAVNLDEIIGEVAEVLRK